MTNEELLKLLIEARSDLVMYQNALRRELWWLEQRDTVARIDKLLDTALDKWLNAEPLDSTKPVAEPGTDSERLDRLDQREAAFREARKNGVPLAKAKADYFADAKAEREEYQRRMEQK